jgi:hypothetical protein
LLPFSQGGVTFLTTKAASKVLMAIYPDVNLPLPNYFIVVDADARNQIHHEG